MARPLRLLVVLACVCSCAWAFGDGLVVDGVGPISGGRAGVNIAHSDNGAILLDNPAGMMNISGNSLTEFSVDTLITDLDYSDRFTSTDGKFKPMPKPEFAIMRKSDDDLWAAGIGVFAPAGFCAEYDMFNPDFGNTTYRSLGMLVKVMPEAAVRVTDRLSVGAGVGLAFSDVELEGPFYLQSGLLRGTPTLMHLHGGGVAPAFNAGLQYELDDQTMLGLAYTEQTDFTLDGSADAHVVTGLPFDVHSRFDSQVDLKWPRSLGGGIRHDFGCGHVVSSDITWYDWSRAFDNIDIHLTDPSNPFFRLLGPVITDRLRLNWRDSISYRVAYEYFGSPCNQYRVGYAYHASPVPDNTLNPYLDGVLEHTVSLGYSRLVGCTSYNCGYEFSCSPTRHVGNSILAGGDFDNSFFKAQAHWIYLGVTWHH